jgi:hypothetical protein
MLHSRWLGEKMDMRLRKVLNFSKTPQISSNPKVSECSAARYQDKVGAAIFKGLPIEILR